MKYILPKFTLPASNQSTSTKDWDRAFLPADEFRFKYGEEPTI